MIEEHGGEAAVDGFLTAIGSDDGLVRRTREGLETVTALSNKVSA